ncbi:MAG: ABC transporter permease subunit [Pirellulales bacterium]|nr:ABC transporter permease subunit [Pirellulales bacterium]
MKLLRAWATLIFLSFSRLLWSASTLMVAFPLLGCALFLVRRHYTFGAAGDDFLTRESAFAAFSEEFVIYLFASFIVPVCALAYGTMSIGGDREDRTLLFLLIRPVPRGMILLAKLLATLPLVVGLVVVSFWSYCKLAGEVGEMALRLYLPMVLFTTIAYVAVFHLFAVTFRHSTIIALVYSLFMELLIGNMPGIIKRVAVNYYGKAMVYDLGSAFGTRVPDPELFVPISAYSASLALLGITLGGILLTMLIFQAREYRDLT